MELTNISAIIIDDEPEAINLLEMYLRSFPFKLLQKKDLNWLKKLYQNSFFWILICLI